MLHLFKRNKTEIITTKKEIEDFSNVEIVADYFKRETGVTFEKQISSLNNKMKLFCKHNEIISYKELLSQLQKDKDLKQDLINLLTTNETYFYREFKQIEELVGIIKSKREKVTILCAPSATGEEPYSIAIALLEAGVAAESFSIMGIDINKEALHKAEEAVYGERNIKYLPKEAVDKYFSEETNKYILKEEIKKQVSFKLVNIFDKEFLQLGKFDFVFSRNMLIYFDKETKQKAKVILESMRKDDKYNIFFGHADLF